MGFVANFIRFLAVQKIENRLRFDKATESLKVRTVWRHSACVVSHCFTIISKKNKENFTQVVEILAEHVIGTLLLLLLLLLLL